MSSTASSTAERVPWRPGDRLRLHAVTTCTQTKLDHPARAEDLYRGDQHLRLMTAVRAARSLGHDATVTILSAKHGFIPGTAPVLPYEETFAGRPYDELDLAGERLQLPEQLREHLTVHAARGEYDLLLVLLGEDYARACKLPVVLNSLHATGAPVALFVGGGDAAICRPTIEAKRLPVTVVRCGVVEAGHAHCAPRALKGELAGRLIRALVSDVDPPAVRGAARTVLDGRLDPAASPWVVGLALCHAPPLYREAPAQTLDRAGRVVGHIDLGDAGDAEVDR